MTFCEEAEFFLANCPGVKMDGGGDGVPARSNGAGIGSVAGDAKPTRYKRGGASRSSDENQSVRDLSHRSSGNRREAGVLSVLVVQDLEAVGAVDGRPI
jgi:hypothetical protein